MSRLAAWARGDARPAVPPTPVCPVVPLEDVASGTGADMPKHHGNCGLQETVPLVPSVPWKNCKVEHRNDRLTNSGRVPDPSRRVSQPLTEAQLDAIGAEWSARFPGR